MPSVSPPADPVARQEWADRASRIAAWRELASYKDPVQPVGPAPKMGAVELRAAWRGAADAAGLSKEDQGIRETSEMLLAAQAREAIRVKAFQPADVAQDLRDTELAKGDAVARGAAHRSRRGQRRRCPEAAEARELAASHKQLADELGVRAAWLAEQDEHRREWHATHAEKMARGVQARAELERRREAGEFVGEWDVANAYLTLESDLEPPKAEAVATVEPQGKTAAEPVAEADAEPEPVAEAETEPQVEAEPKVEADAEPVTAEPEPEVIRPVGSDGQWFLERAQQEAEAKAEAEAEPKVEAATSEPGPGRGRATARGRGGSRHARAGRGRAGHPGRA